MFGRVAVLMGGSSAEREVSLDSGRNVLAALQARGVDAHAVDGIPALVDALVHGKFDRVFNILHGNKGGGEDGVLQGLLEALGGAMHRLRRAGHGPGDGQDPHQAGVDERLACRRRVSCGWRQVRDVQARRAAGPAGDSSSRPAKVPAWASARVTNDAAIDDGGRVLPRDYAGEMLMEQMIVGDELTVGILGDVALPSIRIVPKGEWYDYNAKYVADDTQYLCPGLEGDDEDEIRRDRAGSISRRRLQRLGSRRRHARARQRPHVPAGSEYRAGHDQPFAGAQGRAAAGRRVRRTVLADPGTVRRRPRPHERDAAH